MKVLRRVSSHYHVGKLLANLELSPYPIFIYTKFDDHSFRTHGIIPSFPIQLEGKTMCIKVEVVNAPLNYNPLLGRI
jgi:hypothetical protein